ncbi:hypothetical protein GXW83_23775 [Streptacidiphilus sp. PB12-B1b]|uniref:hypothetical protein n=1 Tax=Streptacidiphilus sp. PB12-B1b TaxID=2705012 RepID=UPI0015FB1932|nr:hypothetical protein [Streptacidiphilus sp. PB12-B1b]QMU78273.1 hypothetical protein GXW83_23775 [Streptacidiphilus sp. PB12-B1b]
MQYQDAELTEGDLQAFDERGYLVRQILDPHETEALKQEIDELTAESGRAKNLGKASPRRRGSG